MRGTSLALFSGIGRRVALAVALSGLLVVFAGLLLQAGKQQRQYREMHQVQMRQAANLAALTIRSRMLSADSALQAIVESTPDAAITPVTRARIVQSGFFNWHVVVPALESGEINAGIVRLNLNGSQLQALAADRSVLQAGPALGGEPGLFIVRAVDTRSPQLLVVQISNVWLWTPMRDSHLDMPVLALDEAGREYFGTMPRTPDLARWIAQRFSSLQPDEDGHYPNGDLSWNAQGGAWVGAMAALEVPSLTSAVRIGIITGGADRPWSVAFASALRTQSALLVAVLVLAALAGEAAGRFYLPAFRQLRRSLSSLPNRITPLAPDARLCREFSQVVDAFNRSAQVIGAQRESQRALEEIDGLLLMGGDYESVIDQVLMRVREATGANNVGLTLVDPAMTGHGRLFAVGADGGCPVNRVVLDEEMTQALRESTTGLTIVRCEEGRHSFLMPLQQGGSEFFWVWPVLVNQELSAVLAVGYPETPPQSARVAACGTQCAQRLGIALSSTARVDKLYRQAHFDPLTQLPNRLLFRDRLAQELAAISQSPARGALLYIDLDHFKKVNDSLGHAAGDQLLSIVAQRLRSCVKDGDTVARLGGDEFTVILRNVSDAAAAAAVADRIIQSMHMPVRLGGRDHMVRASIGVTIFPDDGVQLDDLLRNADLAMYRAKDMGRGTAVFYSPKMTTRGGRVADSGLYRALKRREFSLYFQPQYSVRDGSLRGVEALLRWQRPRDGIVPSAEFIPAAEESGLIVDLGGWVLDAACAQLAQWREMGVSVPTMAVNLSVQQLRDPGLLPELRRVMDRYRIQPAQLAFELNEAALTDADSQTCIEELSELGVALTLDDFGTGHTALANLRRYPVSSVKIDRSFVDQVTDSASAAALASTIIVMAHALEKQVVAEGVETLEQLDFLRERGCDVAQGYFLARPLPSSAMTELLLGRRPEMMSEQSAIA
jgi:diguanylate cyclase (GGDEF)-like protein